MGASSRGDAPWLFALCVASVAAQDGEATDRVVDEAIASLKAMAGLNAKVFTTEDLQNMGPEAFASGIEDAPGGWTRKPPPRKTRSQYRRMLTSFYMEHGMEEKVAGLDAALDKWKGREDRMFIALRQKYAEAVERTEQRKRRTGEGDGAAVPAWEEVSSGSAAAVPPKDET